MSDTAFAGNNTAYTNDDLHNTNANADEVINFENTKTDLNNCLHEALTEKLKPCRYYQPGQKLPVAQKEIKLFMLLVNIRSLQKNLNNLNHELLQTLPYPPNILLLSETKIKLSPLTNKHRAGQRCFELLALIGSPQLSFQRYSQLNKHLGLTGKPYWLAERQMLY